MGKVLEGLGEGLGGSWRVVGALGGELGQNFGAILKVWAGFRSQARLGWRLGRLLADFKGQDGANLRPKKASSCNQNNINIDATIDRKIDGFGNRFLKEFWSILPKKMEASWHQNGSKIDINFESRFLQKALIFSRKNNVL